jgi:hypothetical protein
MPVAVEILTTVLLVVAKRLPAPSYMMPLQARAERTVTTEPFANTTWRRPGSPGSQTYRLPAPS